MANARRYILIIILLILAVYYNSFRNEFVWDDEFLIVNNPSIVSWKYVWIHFATDLYHSFSNYYRPVQMVTYMMDFSLWRLNPLGYHLTNILLHIFVSLSLFTLIRLITDNAMAAFIGTVFYAVHPAHTAAVTYMAGRADSLAALFLLLSILFFHKHFKALNKNTAIYLYISSLFFFLLGVLSKEIAIILPAIIICYRLFFITASEVRRSRDIMGFHYISPFIVILGVYLLLRINALNFQEESVFISRYPLYMRLLTSLKAFGIYLGIIFLPLILHMERNIPYAHSFFETGILLSALLFILVIWLAIRIRRISRPAFFGFLFFIISLLPVMNIYPLTTNMAEHWLYIPLMGVSIFLSSLGIRLWDARKGLKLILSFCLIFYLLFFSYKTVERNFDWQDEETIYTHTFNYNPASIKILNNLGNLYHERGDFENAVAFHKKALKINPREYRTYFNLGRDYEALDMHDKALKQYEKSIICRPDYAKAYFNTGNIYVNRGEYEKAIAAYEHAAKYDDFHIGARNNLGNIYFEKGLYEKAKDKYQEVVGINPYLPAAHNNLGTALNQIGCYEEAIREFKKAIELAPEIADYHSGLGMAYANLAMYDEAIMELKEAYRLKPANVETLINLGVTYFHKGDLARAREEWGNALAVDPKNDIIRNHINQLTDK